MGSSPRMQTRPLTDAEEAARGLRAYDQIRSETEQEAGRLADKAKGETGIGTSDAPGPDTADLAMRRLERALMARELRAGRGSRGAFLTSVSSAGSLDTPPAPTGQYGFFGRSTVLPPRKT